MKDYLVIANSWQVWLCAFICIGTIAVQAIGFARLCYKNARLVGLTKEQCNKSFQCGMVTAIGPSLSCFIGATSMITVVGGPLAWMRLAMIGAAPTELTAAATGAAAYGLEMSSEGYNIEVMANSWMTMALNGCGWLVVVLLLTPSMDKMRTKMGGGDTKWLALITASASIGLFAYMATPYYVLLKKVPPTAWASITGTIAMVICAKLSKKMTWLKEYGLGIAIVAGIIVGAILDK
ncbi:MAG: DUF5058 family protein [Pyramidobacter sp.]|nr:DUF5058 family protein [Pyramidobacter sp.]